MKRSAPSSSSSSSQPSAKRNLSSYFDIKSKVPEPLLSSTPITDRQSTFVAHATTVNSKHAAVQFHAYVRAMRTDSHPLEADHEMLGWRTMALKVNKDGLGGPEDFIVSDGHDNDGENNGGNTVAKAILEEGGVDVAVVVSRYYGGVMLGPARFTHIRTCTIEVLRLLEQSLALPALLKELEELDHEMNLFASPTKAQSYKELTVEKAERLIRAKRKRLEFLAMREEELILKAVEEEERHDRASKERAERTEGAVRVPSNQEDQEEGGDKEISGRSESEPAPEQEYIVYSDVDDQ